MSLSAEIYHQRTPNTHTVALLLQLHTAVTTTRYYYTRHNYYYNYTLPLLLHVTATHVTIKHR